MRQCVELRFEKTDYHEAGSVWIYSHWGGNDTIERSNVARKLHKALKRKERWGDNSYITRIIMSEMFRDSLDEATGYGVSPYHTDACEFVDIIVNLTKQTVEYGIHKWTFEEFVEEFDEEFNGKFRG